MSSAETRSEHMISSLAMLEEPLCDDEYEYYTDEDEADIEDEAECHTLMVKMLCFLMMFMILNIKV